jgi:coenzyme F420-0:L-glutamate ligase / coenzyme F420-1:gamma-L-glutamate ligase
MARGGAGDGVVSVATAFQRETWPQLAEIVRGRASVRYFDGRPVPREALEQIVEAAAWAPSPHGRQPWRFAILRSASTKERLAEAMGETWQRQLALDGDPPEIIEARREGSRRRILEAPALITPCLYTKDLDHYPDPDRQQAEEIMAIQSLGAATQNMLLMAYALGLDSGWMCAPLFCPDVVREVLRLPDELTPHALIAVGYRGREPRRRPRRPLAELIVLDD